MLTMKEIKNNNKNGNFIAIGNDNKKYNAAYNAQLKTMFFCIPLHVEIIGYMEG